MELDYRSENIYNINILHIFPHTKMIYNLNVRKIHNFVSESQKQKKTTVFI